MTDFDLGWAVGFFEGEGSITVRKGKSIQLQVASIDTDTLARFQRIIGRGRVYGPYGPYQVRRKPHWRWDAYGAEARVVLRELLPYLCSRRAIKAQEALDAT